MSFFLKKGQKMGGGGTRKRKVAAGAAGASSKKARNNVANGGKKSRRDDDFGDEEIPSDDSDLDAGANDDDVGYDSHEDDGNAETAEEKRVRLAKAYLEEIEKEERDRAEDAEAVHDAVNERLRRDNLEEIGKLRRDVAHLVVPSVDPDKIRRLRDKKGTAKPVTCVAVSPDGRRVYAGAKDGAVVVFDLVTGQRVHKILAGKKGQEAAHLGHCTAVNCVAVSSDGKFLASGDDSKLIHVWEAATMELVKTFKGHRDAVSGLAFRKKTHTLYSCSLDRSVKIWSLDEMSYVETLFGHQDSVTAIDAGLRERAVTSGGRDGTVRVWKIVEESQLVFNGPAVSVDSVRLVNEEHFATCGEDGHVSLWGVMKKKPLCTVSAAHGADASGNGQANWVSSVAALPMSDLLATGSCDGQVRLWQCGANFRSLSPLFSVPVPGFVNSLAFTPDGKQLVAGVGQEHRLGRWWRIKEAKNSVIVIPIETTAEIK